VAAGPGQLEDALRNLSEGLQRELKAAQSRAADLAARRRGLELELEAARAAERAAVQTVEALRSIRRQGAEPATTNADGTDDGSLLPLAGARLREMIARVGLRRGASGGPAHWREWLVWLRDAGYDAAGKSPEATFQTQLARSPLVRRTQREGVYRIELAELARGRDRLRELHQQLSQLPLPDQLALLGDVRSQRQDLQNEIAKVERAVEEIWRILAQERPPGWLNHDDEEPERVIEAWLVFDAQ
jgi:hypothetical protein